MQLFIAILIIIAGFVGGGYAIVQHDNADQIIPLDRVPDGPDGIRNPPKPAPVDDESTMTLSVGETKSLRNSTLMLQGVNDSRCPTGVTCIWAGTVIASLKLTTSTGTENVSIELGKSITTESDRITLVSASYPPAKDDEPIPQESYRLVFTIVPR